MLQKSFHLSQLNIDDTEVLCSALLHEQQHYLDDFANGFPGNEFNFQIKKQNTS